MKLKVFLVALVAILLLAGCSKSSNKNAPILIGVAGAHSGDLAPYGLPTVNAVELVVEDWNKKGGVLGRQIKVLVEDDGCKPELASNVASKLVGEKVTGVIGHICSGATKAAMGIYRDSKIIAISPSATNPDLTAGNYPNFFRTIAPDDAQAAVEVELIKKLGIKKIAILHDKGDYGKGFATFVKDMIKEDGSVEVKLFQGITVGAVDYSAILNKVSGANVDAIVFGGYHPEASKLVEQMHKMKLNIPFLSDDGVKDNTFIKVAGEYAEGVYATGPIDTSASPAAQKALQMHKDKYGEDAGTFFLNAFAATEALLTGIEKAGSTNYDDIRNALLSMKVETPLGNIGFDSSGNPKGVGFSGFQVVNGVYTEVK